MFMLRNTLSFTNFYFFSTMGYVILQGQCARSMLLQTWLRPTAFKNGAIVEFLAGDFFRSSIYITEGDHPAGKGHPIPVFQKVIYLYFPLYLTLCFLPVVIEPLHRMCSIHFVPRSKKEKR